MHRRDAQRPAFPSNRGGVDFQLLCDPGVGFFAKPRELLFGPLRGLFAARVAKRFDAQLLSLFEHSCFGQAEFCGDIDI